jgi:hypothetical protein
LLKKKIVIKTQLHLPKKILFGDITITYIYLYVQIVYIKLTRLYPYKSVTLDVVKPFFTATVFVHVVSYYILYNIYIVTECVLGKVNEPRLVKRFFVVHSRVS